MNVIFDLDGTLADCSHRQHLISDVARRESEAAAWEKFFAACPGDQPIAAVINVLCALVDAGHDVSIWTGRSETVRRQTVDWLERHIGFVPRMRMRPENDFTPDAELKHRWLVLTPKEDSPDLVFEDRKRVVDMFRKYGVMCVQVAEDAY